MSNPTSPIISPQDISPITGFVIVDARSGGGAYERHASNHLEGALHADLDRHLMKKLTDPAHGGRHPLPEVKDFVAFLGKLGITPSSRVVVYDDKSGANAAARFWWMLRAVGHVYVQVVDGGLDAIMRAGLPMSSAIHKPAATLPYPADSWKLPTVTIDDVAKAATNRDALVIDVREAYRYRGESEPIDLIAGHIPGAVNIPYFNNLTADGGFRSREALASQYKSALGTRDPTKVIVHCGSGVTACHTLLALEQAGIKSANLYVGSWSEWSRRDYPIGKAE